MSLLSPRSANPCLAKNNKVSTIFTKHRRFNSIWLAVDSCCISLTSPHRGKRLLLIYDNLQIGVHQTKKGHVSSLNNLLMEKTLSLSFDWWRLQAKRFCFPNTLLGNTYELLSRTLISIVGLFTTKVSPNTYSISAETLAVNLTRCYVWNFPFIHT